MRVLVSRTTCVFKSNFQALLIRRGHKRSIIAIAHKLLRIIYFIVQRGQYYRDRATNYEELSVKKNAPRCIKSLVNFGLIPQPF